MAESPRLSLRLSEEMDAALRRQAKTEKISPSAMARRLLANALRRKGLADVPREGRPTLSKKP